jgi:hypothetical protein
MTKKDIAIDFLKLASSDKVDEAYDKYIHPGFIHHNAYYKGDRETLLRGWYFLKSRQAKKKI